MSCSRDKYMTFTWNEIMMICTPFGKKGIWSYVLFIWERIYRSSLCSPYPGFRSGAFFASIQHWNITIYSRADVFIDTLKAIYQTLYKFKLLIGLIYPFKHLILIFSILSNELEGNGDGGYIHWFLSTTSKPRINRLKHWCVSRPILPIRQ